MSRRIDYYFSMISPWANIGHAVLMDVVRRRGVTVSYKPVSLGNVFSETGGLPLPKRHPVRQRYRILELQRWRDKRGLKFRLHPKFWPFDVGLADRFVIAIGASGRDPDAFMRAAFAALWEGEKDLADRATIEELAGGAGLPGREILAAAERDASRDAYEQNFRDALAADVFGSPCYVLDGEVFWGQDRIELLDDALAGGRGPYRPDA